MGGGALTNPRGWLYTNIMQFTEDVNFKQGDKIVARMELLGLDMKTVEVPENTPGEIVSVKRYGKDGKSGAEVLEVRFEGIEKLRYFTQGAPALAYP